jgi:PAS domain S-box-containing protein
MKDKPLVTATTVQTILAGVGGAAMFISAFVGADPLVCVVIGSLLVLSSICSRISFSKQSRAADTSRLEVLNEKATRLAAGVCKQSSSKADPYENLDSCISIFEADLLEGRRKERAIIEHSIDVICIIDVTARFLSVSPVAERSWGYSSAELVGTLLTDYIVAEDAASVLNTVLGSEASVDVLAFETRLRKKGGQQLTLLWSAHWSAGDQGLFCIVHDVTARKKAEDLLKKSEERLQGILSALPVGVLLVTGDEGIVAFANDAALSLVGSRNESHTPSTLAEFVPSVPTSAVPNFLNSVERLHQSTTELPMNKVDGSRLIVELTVVPVTQSHQFYHLCALVDVTAKKEIEELKRDFVAMVSHDLRSPLTSIRILMELLLQSMFGELTDQGTEMVEQGIRNTGSLLKLVSDLIDLEQADSGTLISELVCVPVEEILAQSIDTVQQLASARNIQVEVTAGDPLDSLVQGDRQRLVQVLVNLLANAIKFSANSSTISVHCEMELADDRELVKIIVKDHGRGVPLEFQKKIFERFKQTQTTDRTEKVGSGLGLAICKKIVEEHKGKIGVESEPGNGSRFWFTVPLYVRPLATVS